MTRLLLLASVVSLAVVTPVSGAEWFVSAGATGNGARNSPFGRIQLALDAAAEGDTITVAPGEYHESLATVRPSVLLRSTTSRGAIVTASGRVLTIRHPHVTVEGFVFDGQFGRDNIVRLTNAASATVLRDLEVRRSSRDAVDIKSPTDIVIEHCLIHDALNPDDGRTDAHGIALSAARRVTIRDTEIHTFSGDGIQIDPARASPGWTDVTIEHCRIWLGPLPEARNGFPAGVAPGENAVDTKASAAFPRARIEIKDTVAHGFRGGLIDNMAAFNLKENIDIVLDGLTVYDSEIAFRLRGPGVNNGAQVRLMNTVVYDSLIAIRYEDNIERLQVWNCTIGGGVDRPFTAASSRRDVADVRNVLLLGPSLPAEARDKSNRAVRADAFVNAAAHDYRLAEQSPAIDAGVAIPDVTHDRAGTKRPQRRAYDIGAYERDQMP